MANENFDTSKLKPFNLKDALAGKPVVNGRGTKVFITKYAVPVLGNSLLSQNKDSNMIAHHNLEGKTKLSLAGYDNSHDLYMAPITVNKWLNLYGYCYTAFYSKEEADRTASPQRLGGKAFLISYEE